MNPKLKKLLVKQFCYDDYNFAGGGSGKVKRAYGIKGSGKLKKRKK